MDTVFGLPAHILLVHAVVVLCPLAALLGLAVAVRAPWAFYLRWPLLLLSVAGAVLAVLAAGAGEALEHRLGADGFLAEHAAAGTLLQWVAAAFAVAAILAFLAIDAPSPLRSGRGGYRSPLPRVMSPVSRLLLAAIAIWLVVQTAITGHSGSQAVWGSVVDATSNE